MPMGVCLLSVVMLCVAAVLAVMPCDQTILDKLKKSKYCYPRHLPPSQELPGVKYTHLLTSNADLPIGSEEEGFPICINSKRKDEKTVTVTYKFKHIEPVKRDPMGNFISLEQTVVRDMDVSYRRMVDGDHILETDSNGVKYKLYVIRNEYNVYSYYRCIHSENVEGNGYHQVEAAMEWNTASHVHFELQDYRRADAVMKSVKICVKHLGIKPNVVKMTRCAE